MADSIKGLIQGMMPMDAELMQGKVISVNPLKIRMVNDEKLVINERICIVPWHLTNYQQTCDLSQGDGICVGSTAFANKHTHKNNGTTENGGGPAHSHSYKSDTEEAPAHSHRMDTCSLITYTITVYNALKVGETVHVLSLNNGKLYYVLDRVVT